MILVQQIQPDGPKEKMGTVTDPTNMPRGRGKVQMPTEIASNNNDQSDTNQAREQHQRMASRTNKTT